MKQIFLLILLLPIIITKVIAQPNQSMSYQAVVRDVNNNLVVNTTVGVRLSVIQGSVSGTAVYVETQNPLTNANGLISLEFGRGVVVSGTFANIDWSAGPYFIKSETDPSGGTNYSIIGTSEILSVPYALYSAQSDSCKNINGTTNKVTKFLTPNSLGNSQIFDDGTNVGIGTDTPSTTLDVNGFTKLGSNSPKIKLLKLTGTTANTQGASVTIIHGISIPKILSVEVLVEAANGVYYPPGYSVSTNYLYSFRCTIGGIVIINSSSSGLILSKPVRILITYEN